ncbi:xanthine dehydrogenase accessory protein XdhC [Chelativorans sp. ZYF759]|uniref:xanthine dehydrogenase accessory protein XdhC n=1 Tax=Chelativorans sp. ZYF759 TaxID=2692213 RepID=UPI00145D998E|nr:xanthine dehydrogenase accessory protein XdhC [Chelativorans sp. ZYF759]NMG39229.1 xanthine dehydrogenase accessory protein XdhC [Chelativorans sp. ZYF759]
MTFLSRSLHAFLASSPAVALVEVVSANGSTPREAGAWMLVSPVAIFGTIGGGQLEFMAIDRAREMIEAGRPATDLLDIPLGPEIGQCCGGRVKIDIALVDEELREAIPGRIEWEDAQRPHVYLFGGGHVGTALAATLSLLPLHVVVVETRADALGDMPEGIETRLTSVPEEVVRDAPSGSAFIVLTHDHALDFLIVGEALARADSAYVGMIGSKTKRETLRRWYLKEAGGDEATLSRLVCPIGGADVKDKRPAVIAALVAAEVVRELSAASALGSA